MEGLGLVMYCDLHSGSNRCAVLIAWHLLRTQNVERLVIGIELRDNEPQRVLLNSWSEGLSIDVAAQGVSYDERQSIGCTRQGSLMVHPHCVCLAMILNRPLLRRQSNLC